MYAGCNDHQTYANIRKHEARTMIACFLIADRPLIDVEMILQLHGLAPMSFVRA